MPECDRPFRLDGTAALVTGASGGLGPHCCARAGPALMTGASLIVDGGHPVGGL